MENIFKKLEELESKIEQNLLSSKDFLDLNEASKYLKLSKSALYKLTSQGLITYYQPGGKKIYFYKSDLHQWLKTGKVQSQKAIINEISSFLNNKENSRP